MIAKFKQFDTSTLEFEKVNVRSDTVILPRVLSGECPLFQLPKIDLNCYGIPKQSKYYPAIKDRLFIQLPLHGELLNKMRELDNFMSSECMKSDLFGDNSDYQYFPSVKIGSRGEYVKIKLETDYKTGDIETCLVKNGVVMSGTESLPEFEQQIPYNSKVKAIIKLVRVWQINNKYGVTFKLQKVSVEHQELEPVNLEALQFID
jgi:hypothetical protein